MFGLFAAIGVEVRHLVKKGETDTSDILNDRDQELELKM
jgi:hypothetical protein